LIRFEFFSTTLRKSSSQHLQLHPSSDHIAVQSFSALSYQFILFLLPDHLSDAHTTFFADLSFLSFLATFSFDVSSFVL